MDLGSVARGLSALGQWCKQIGVSKGLCVDSWSRAADIDAGCWHGMNV